MRVLSNFPSQFIRPVLSPCLYYWRPKSGVNFGDELSWHITKRILRDAGKAEGSLIPCGRPRWSGQRIFGLGSILHQCRAGDIVWGAGINGKIGTSSYSFQGVDFRATRGPLSRTMVERNGGACPPVYGDPALLVPMLFPELVPTDGEGDKVPVTVIYNINDECLFDLDRQEDPSRRYLSPTGNWRDVIKGITQSELVVSSSLHGLVLADAFGVPCRPLVSMFEARFKYEDYFLATNRRQVVYAASVDEAIELGPIPKPDIDLAALYEAFPLDAF